MTRSPASTSSSARPRSSDVRGAPPRSAFMKDRAPLRRPFLLPGRSRVFVAMMAGRPLRFCSRQGFEARQAIAAARSGVPRGKAAEGPIESIDVSARPQCHNQSTCSPSALPFAPARAALGGLGAGDEVQQGREGQRAGKRQHHWRLGADPDAPEAALPRSRSASGRRAPLFPSLGCRCCSDVDRFEPMPDLRRRAACRALWPRGTRKHAQSGARASRLA